MDTISQLQFDSLFKEIALFKLDKQRVKREIKLINTFRVFYFCFSNSDKEKYRKIRDSFESNWLDIKQQYGFELSVGGSYFSKQLNIRYGGPPGDYFEISDFSNCFKERYEKYAEEDWE